ncbi:MAG: hypothetical protein V4654_08650 [Bdellovibrionota bacterium]
MDEFKFVLKCFLISCVIVVFSQTRVAGETLENKAFVFLQHSETAHWVRAAADGGIKMIRQGAEMTQNFISDKFGSVERTSSSQRAVATTTAASNTGLFRKLEKKETQQRGDTAEPELESENNVEDQY